MTTRRDRSQIELTALPREGEAAGAVLVLEGSSRDDLRKASGFAGLLADRCVLIAVDGGLRTCRAARVRPDLFVGDLDSARRVPRGLPSVVFPSAKDFSDLAGALREARRRSIDVVVVAGLLGGRLDHEWANLLELGAHARRFAGLLAPTSRGLVLVTSRGCRAATPRRKTVSVLALGGGATVSLTGTRWALRRRRLRPGSTGLSNVTSGPMQLRVHRGAVAVLFPTC